ncbi:hypothetical protein TYRP_014589 [Tyrophagus putrescentiae]|nr:hypothetical protein TYRP_014589 [Tyrophagus putrescentiae]
MRSWNIFRHCSCHRSCCRALFEHLLAPYCLLNVKLARIGALGQFRLRLRLPCAYTARYALKHSLTRLHCPLDRYVDFQL